MASSRGLVAVAALGPADYEAAIPELAALLIDAVESGASVNFLAGVSRSEAETWWQARLPLVADGTLTALVAHDARAGRGDEGIGEIVGCTLLLRSRNQNAPHRAEIGKVLVHTAARRRGVARALMEAAEQVAREDGRWLLHLDTETGSAAEALYRSLGWNQLGTMPNHSLRTDGVPAATTFFWKDLRA